MEIVGYFYFENKGINMQYERVSLIFHHFKNDR